MGFRNRTHAIQTEPIVALAHVSERFASPIFGRQFETRFRFAQLEDETIIVDASLGRDRFDVALVVKRVAENFEKSLLSQLRIDL